MSCSQLGSAIASRARSALGNEVPLGVFPNDVESAARALAARDALISEFYARFGAPRLHRGAFDPGREVTRTDVDAFAFLVETLVYQQLSGASARAIFARLEERVGVDPLRIARATEPELRAIGLSAPKIRTLRALVDEVDTGRLDLAALAHAPDDQVMTTICGLKGFGPWSAEMFLIFHLRRLDVWPVGDLALRRAIARRLNEGVAVDPRSAARLGERFRPFRSIATWYLWADDHALVAGEA